VAKGEKIMQKKLSLFFVLCLLILQVSDISIQAKEMTVDLQGEITKSVEKSITYFHDLQNEDGGFPAKKGRESNVSLTCWVIMALEAAGEDVTGLRWTKSFNPVDYIRNTKVDKKDTNTYAKLLLTLTAAGEREGTLYSTAKYKLIFRQQEEGNFCAPELGELSMVNAHMWSVLALLSTESYLSEKEAAKQWLIDAQNEDGGFSWLLENESDTDDTAIAIMTLTLMGEGKETKTIQRAMEFIRARQTSTGGFNSSDSMGSSANAASDAWAIQAMYAMGEDPNELIMDGNNPFTHLLSLQDDQGFFYWKEDVESSPVQMTAYALMALSKKPFPVNIDYTSLQSSLFSDFSEVDFGYSEVVDLVQRGIITGYKDGTFKPDREVSRAELTTMIVKALDDQTEDRFILISFEDVEREAWYYPYVQKAFSKGIIKGKSSKIFDPLGMITGGELAAVLIGSIEGINQENLNQGDYWYSGYVEKADELNLLFPEFSPMANVTRVECAYAIEQLLKNRE